MRRSLLLAAAVVLAAALPAAPASADARGCSGSFSGPVSCTFSLLPDDARVVVSVHPDAGSDPVAAQVLCCVLINPVTGEQLRDQNGEPAYLVGAQCLGAGGCETSVTQPPGNGVVHDGTARCDIGGEAGSTISGTWSCLPVTP
jgi:hypothetical protein